MATDTGDETKDCVESWQRVETLSFLGNFVKHSRSGTADVVLDGGALLNFQFKGVKMRRDSLIGLWSCCELATREYIHF